ncbi:MAG: DUF433 domain-containing protein [Actinobacteria bacterium]|nr:DUF433 domain-containing protein [Actinomycetota bacterium]
MSDILNISKPRLGAGIYTVPDISLILGLPQDKVRRWHGTYWNNRMKTEDISYSWGSGRQLAMDFYMLIEFFVFYKLREKKISSQQIITAHQTIAKDIGNPYPFATTYISSDENKIFYSPDKNKTIIKADPTQQIAIKKIIENYIKKIDFDSTFLAERFWPRGRDKNIVVDPHHQFGQPIIKNTNIQAETIYLFYKGGEKKDFIARLYNIDIKSVNDSINFFEKAA